MPGLEHAYLLAAVIILGPLYFLIWWEYKDLQKKMVRLSLFGAIAGPISQWWYLEDYWHPTFSLGAFGFVEDLIFAFLLIGVTAASVNVILNRRSADAGKPGRRTRYLLAFVIAVGALIFLTSMAGMNSIYASTIGFLVIAFIIWRDRPDLFPYSLIGGTAMLVWTAIAYSVILYLWPTFIDEWWLHSNISGISFLHIPIEEFLWFGSWGLVGSVLYEWRHGYTFVSRRPNTKTA